MKKLFSKEYKAFFSAFFIALFFILPVCAFAQKFELGKVSVAELEQKAHPSDPSAVAAILYSRGKTYFDYTANNGFYSMTEVEVRIKINRAVVSHSYYEGIKSFFKTMIEKQNEKIILKKV